MATATEAEPAPTPSDLEPEGLDEVVDGRVVEKPSLGAYEAELANILARLLGDHLRTGRLGRVVVEMLFRLDVARKLDRRPDVAFVSHQRWAIERRAPRTAAWEVVPDLAVEVLSPGNRSVDDLAKLGDYFRAGVRLVWVVYPTLGMVYVYDAPTSVRILTRADAIDGGEVIPGFRLPLAELFGDETE